MHPWIIQYPPITSYGVCIVAGLLLAWVWARSRARAVRIDPSHMDLLMPVLVGAGLLGAWLFGIWTDSATGDEANGTVLIGSLLIATAAGIGYALIARIPLGVLGDICAAPLALGIAVGRLGCFFAGCCYGKVCNPAVGLRFPHGSFAFIDQVQHGLLAADAARSLPVYPTQLIESALCALLAIFIWRIAGRLRISGEQFLVMGAGYAVLRFAVEFFRADNPPVLWLGSLSFTFSQVASILILVLVGATWQVRRMNAGRWGLFRSRQLQPATAR